MYRKMGSSFSEDNQITKYIIQSYDDELAAELHRHVGKVQLSDEEPQHPFLDCQCNKSSQTETCELSEEGSHSYCMGDEYPLSIREECK